MMQVQKYGTAIPVSDAITRDMGAIDQMFREYRAASPEQREAWRREADEKRARLRAEAPEETDILAGVGRHFGWSPEYLRHLAQPYCDCDYDNDGAWNYCPHARDLGLGNQGR